MVVSHCKHGRWWWIVDKRYDVVSVVPTSAMFRESSLFDEGLGMLWIVDTVVVGNVFQWCSWSKLWLLCSSSVGDGLLTFPDDLIRYSWCTWRSIQSPLHHPVCWYNRRRCPPSLAVLLPCPLHPLDSYPDLLVGVGEVGRWSSSSRWYTQRKPNGEGNVVVLWRLWRRSI